MIKFEKVTKTYHVGDSAVHALHGADVMIQPYECVAIVGPSGSGKSTMMHIMGLLDTPTSGHYFLDGVDVSTLSPKARARCRNAKIGFVFQSFYLLPRLTAIENVALPLMYRGVPAEERRERAKSMLAKVEMERFIAHRPNALSGGQQQRVALARALVGEPEVILADEPTGALDTQTGGVVLELIQSFQSQATIVIITHDLSIAEQCDRKLSILDGQCIS